MPKLHDSCPDCGGSKDIRSARCRKCSYVIQDTKRLNSICPECGGVKDYRAALCANCGRITNSGIDFDAIEPAWAYAFFGLFMGEGSVGLYVDNRSRGSVHARASIKMRADERELLSDIARKLGANVYPENARDGSNPILVWATTNTAQVLDLCNFLLNHNVLPAKKLRDIEIVQRFCVWRMSQGYRVDNWDYAHELRNQLLKCREFSDNG